MYSHFKQSKVYIYMNDDHMMRGEVYRHQCIETGGDLFGLWTTSGDVVIHAVLGPGKNCRRTETSFHQDIPYLQRVGDFLNKNYMLCHIGEWHSHHQLALDEPSAGDIRTVWNNYPEGMKKFLVIIGNLRVYARDGEKVMLSPYFFIGDEKKCIKANLEVLDVNSPFTSDTVIAEEMRRGSETEARETGAHQRSGQRSRVEYDAHHEISRQDNISRQNIEHTSSFVNPAMSEHGITFPPSAPLPDYDNCALPSSLMALVSTTEKGEASSAQLLATKKRPLDPPLSSSQTDDKQTRREAIIKKTHDKIESHFGRPQIDIEGKLDDKVEMKFKHNNKFWSICFPSNFPKQPAKIRASFSESTNSRYITPTYPMKPESLNNHVNILLAIQRECSQYSSCTSCKKSSLQALVDNSDRDIEMFLTEEGSSFVREFCQKVRDIADTGSLKTELIIIDTKNSVEEPIVKISLRHASKIWLVRLTSTFPDRAAKASCIDEEICGGKYETSFQFSNVRNNNFVSQVLLAITQKCCCEKCKRLDVV